MKHYNVLKWGILILAYGFLLYKITTFDNYNDFFKQWEEIPFYQFVWLLLTIFLLPLNWLLESAKWKEIVKRLEFISLKKSFQSVLSGITVGFFTPNRIGEYPGRVVFLNNVNRIPAIVLGFIGTLAQTLAIVICGIPSAVVFFTLREDVNQLSSKALWLFFIAIGITIFAIYIFLPNISKWILKHHIKYSKVVTTLQAVRQCSKKSLLKIFLLSFFRYSVFCLQFYCILKFFGVTISVSEAIIGIATNYLFVTFTPSLALSEVAIRGSYSIIFIGAFSNNLIGVATAGITIWLINYCLPMIVGSFFVAKSNL